MKTNHDYDLKLDKISRKLSFSSINPTNVEKERQRFFSEKGYEPQFEYAHHKNNLENLKHELSLVTPDDSVVGKVLAGIRDKYLLDICLIESRGTEQFQDASMKLYGEPDKRLLRQARKLIYLKVRPEPNEYSTQQIIRKLRLAFMKYGFDWKIEQKDMVANAAVRQSERLLLIKKNARFSHEFLKRIIVHEIGTHVLRAENGASQPYLFFARGLPGYLMTEEGLAVYNEEQNDCLNNYILKVYAGRVLAVHLAMQSSFSEVYESLRRYFTKNTAWRLTVRAKRGLKDTSRAGAFTKDIAYLKGYMSIKDFVAKKGDMNQLYYGKVGIDHISLLQEMEGLINPRLLPMNRYIHYLKNHFSTAMDSMLFMSNVEPFAFSQLKLD